MLRAADGDGETVAVAHTVLLGAIAKITTTESPYQFRRRNGKRQITVQANVRGRELGTFVEDAKLRLGRIELPPGGWLEWAVRTKTSRRRANGSRSSCRWRSS